MFFETGMFMDLLKKYLTHKLICQWVKKAFPYPKRDNPKQFC